VTLTEVINNSDIKEAPGEYFAIREIYLPNIKGPTFRLRCIPLTFDVSLESDDGDGFRFSVSDLEAEDWLVLPNEEIGGRAA